MLAEVSKNGGAYYEEVAVFCVKYPLRGDRFYDKQSGKVKTSGSNKRNVAVRARRGNFYNPDWLFHVS